MKNIWFVVIILALFLSCSKKSVEQKETIKQPETETQVQETVTEIDSVKPPEYKKIPTKESLEKSETEKIPESSAGLWTAYNTAKANLETAKQKDDIIEIKKYLLEAAFFANQLNRKDIEAWQYNNISYFSIEEFKKRTDYNTRMRKIESMKPGEDKNVYIQEVKKNFLNEKSLIIDAEKYLVEAQNIDKELDDEARTAIINSNLQFIKFIKDFIGE